MPEIQPNPYAFPSAPQFAVQSLPMRILVRIQRSVPYAYIRDFSRVTTVSDPASTSNTPRNS